MLEFLTSDVSGWVPEIWGFMYTHGTQANTGCLPSIGRLFIVIKPILATSFVNNMSDLDYLSDNSYVLSDLEQDLENNEACIAGVNPVQPYAFEPHVPASDRLPNTTLDSDTDSDPAC